MYANIIMKKHMQLSQNISLALIFGSFWIEQPLKVKRLHFDKLSIINYVILI